MKPFSKITLQLRKGYREVFIYYSKQGVKFRESTTVKIPDQDVFDLEGPLTETSNLEIIRKTHRQVENVILRYIRQYNEKPPVQWLRIEFDKIKTEVFYFPSCKTTSGQLKEMMPSLLPRVKTNVNPKMQIMTCSFTGKTLSC